MVRGDAIARALEHAPSAGIVVASGFENESSHHRRSRELHWRRRRARGVQRPPPAQRMPRPQIAGWRLRVPGMVRTSDRRLRSGRLSFLLTAAARGVSTFYGATPATKDGTILGTNDVGFKMLADLASGVGGVVAGGRSACFVAAAHTSGRTTNERRIVATCTRRQRGVARRRPSWPFPRS